LVKENNRRGLIILLVFTFFMVTGFEMIMPLVIGHYVHNLNFSATSVAFALTVRRFSQQGLALVGGVLADRLDIRRLIILGVFLRAFGFFTMVFANSFIFLLISMALIGFGGVLFDTPYQSAIAMLTNEKNRSKYYSLNNTVVGVGTTLGPLIGIFLLSFDFALVSFGAAICFLINGAISIFFMPKIIKTTQAYTIKTSLKIVVKDKSFMKFMFFMVIFWIAASQIDIAFPLKMQEISGNQTSVGIMYALYAIITALFQYPLVSFMLTKFISRQIVVIGIFFIANSLLIISFAATTSFVLISVSVFSLGMLLARPNQQTIAVAMSNPKALGVYLGINSLSMAIGSGLGTMMGGIFFDLARGTNLDSLPWILFSMFAVVSMLGFFFSKDIGQKRELP